MSKFKKSPEAISSGLLLWAAPPHTNTSVSDIYDIDVYPINSIIQGAGQTVTFNVPPQETGFLIDIDVVATFRITNGEHNLTDKAQVSIVNNIAAAMFSLVDVRINERLSLLQAMTNSYNLCTFFENILNQEANRRDILFAKELFVMDTGSSKAESQNGIYVVDNHHDAAAITNKGAGKRAKSIAKSAKCTVTSKLNVPLFKQHKGLLPNTQITITFSVNKNEYCIMGKEDGLRLNIDELFLRCTFIKPQPILLNLINERLQTTPVIYECDKQVVLARLLPTGSRLYTINNMFENVLPKFVCFSLQLQEDLQGKMQSNVFTFQNINSLQLYINNKQFFPKPLKNVASELLNQIYISQGRDLKGSCLITSENLVLNQFYPICLTDDRTIGKHYNIKRTADTRIEIDLGAETTETYVLLAYCLYDTQISIDGKGEVIITE